MSDRPLWAPWRIEYITGPKEEQCIFCTAARAGERCEPARRPLDRSQRCFTLLNAYPYAPGHLMVAPVRHVAQLDELDEDELHELMTLARRAVMALRQAMAPDGFNTGLNLGRVAGAGIVDHLHMHVVPRWDGDTNFMPLVADTRVIPQALAAAHDVLQDAFSKLRG